MKYKIGIVIASILVMPLVTMGCGPYTTIATSPVSYHILSNFNKINTASSLSANGLALSISLNSTKYKPGQGIRIDIDEHNTLSTDIDNPFSVNWSYYSLSLGGCGDYLNLPFMGIGIVKGSYTSANISDGTPLSFWNYSQAVPCPTPEAPAPDYDFPPRSDMFAEIDFNGYWSGEPTATLLNFPPGVYTAAGGDEWGNLVVAHFTVSN
jgi:hypothetical protein